MGQSPSSAVLQPRRAEELCLCRLLQEFGVFSLGLLYGVKPTDPLTYITLSLLMIAVAMLACYIPAHRAAKIDPMVAPRYE